VPQQPQLQQQQQQQLQQQQQYYNVPPIPVSLTQRPLHPSGRPKRPPNAFLVFSNVRRRELQKLYPSNKTAALSKRLGEEWRDMSPERKAVYTSQAKEIKDSFQVSHPDYVYTRRSSKKRALADVDSGSSKKFKGSDNYGGGGYVSSTGLDPNRPRRPMNSYLIFNQEMRHKLLQENANLTVSEISRAIGTRWASMTPELKREYTEKAALIKTDFMKKHPDYVYSRRSKAEIAASGAARRRGGGGGSSGGGSSSAAQPLNVPVSGKGSRNGSGQGTTQASSTSSVNNINNGNGNSSASSNSNNNRANGAANNNGLHPDGAGDARDGKRSKKKTKDPDAPKHPIPGFLFFRSGERERIRQENPNQPIPAVAARMWNDMTPEQREPWLQMAAKDKKRYAEEMQAYAARKGRTNKRP
ncbi:hypothetical protein BGX31_001567, partial [Mortierella sp. GBA43]